MIDLLDISCGARPSRGLVVASTGSTAPNEGWKAISDAKQLANRASLLDSQHVGLSSTAANARMPSSVYVIKSAFDVRGSFPFLYRRLGVRSGPDGSRAARERVFEALVAGGEGAASWLAARLGAERNVEVVLDASHVLERIGDPRPMLRQLGSGALTPEARRGFWSVLGALRVRDVGLMVSLAERDLRHADADMRETIYEALATKGALGSAALRRAKRSERLPELSDLLERIVGP